MEAPAPPTLRVLHLEDDPLDCEIVRDRLRQDGIECEVQCVAGRGEYSAALEAFAPDLILSDHALPGFDGVSALRMARSLRPAVPFIFVSGAILEDEAIEMLKQGATDYVLKNHLGRLCPAVRRALQEAREQDERQRAQAALRDSERLLRQIIDLVPHFIFAKDAEGRFLLANQAVADACGATVTELQGRTEGDFFRPPAEVQRSLAQDRAVMEAGCSKSIVEETVTGAGGLARIVQTTRIPFALPGSTERAVLGVSTDITELRLAATAFQSHEGIFITDADGVIQRVNRAFLDITGFTGESAIGMRAKALFATGGDDSPCRWDTFVASGQAYWQGEAQARRAGGEVYPIWETITAVRRDDGAVTHYVCHFQDISERKQIQERIEYLAFHDSLTHLPNRSLLMDRLQQAVARNRRRGLSGALLYLDLDHFKNINDSLGHPTGDLLLCDVARCLLAQVRGEDTVARLGGDEFVVLLPQLEGGREAVAREARTIAQKIREALSSDFIIAGDRLRASASIGVILFPEGEESADDILRHADIAMYQAKAAGRNTVRFFSPEMQAAVTERLLLEGQLRDAVARQEFMAYFQPQIELATGRLFGVESLLRWRHPARGLQPPSSFIPLLEDTGLILPVGQWLLRHVCETLGALQDKGHEVRVAVNVSPRQFYQADFADRIRDVLAETGTSPESLELEITESAVIDDIDHTIGIMRRLKDQGVRFSLDDFGTGYSSLSYLKRLPLDTLKIDRAFVHDCTTDANDADIVRAIIAMASSLGLEVVAEGVETGPQLEFLRSLGCAYYQGYLFSPPVPMDRLIALLDDRTASGREGQV